MFRELYFYRWPVETKYKELKSRLAIEEFSGATTTSVLQEFLYQRTSFKPVISY